MLMSMLCPDTLTAFCYLFKPETRVSGTDVFNHKTERRVMRKTHKYAMFARDRHEQPLRPVKTPAI